MINREDSNMTGEAHPAEFNEDTRDRVAVDPLINDDGAIIRDDVILGRGKSFHMVGREGGVRMNIDTYGAGTIECAEIDERGARRMLGILARFVRPRPSKTGKVPDPTVVRTWCPVCGRIMPDRHHTAPGMTQWCTGTPVETTYTLTDVSTQNGGRGQDLPRTGNPYPRV